ncbi:MAG: phytanoyl-CoA dioxygenase family protein [Acidobacteriota bacterium]
MIDFDTATLPWIDRDDYTSVLAEKRRTGALSDTDSELTERWSRDGYLHLPGLIDQADVDALLAAYERAWETRPEVKLLVEGKGVVPFAELEPRAELVTRHYRVMDIQDTESTARDLILHAEVQRVLRLLLDDTPVAMQSLFFEYGSEQHLHQDFPYVQAQILSHLIGCWIACEDADLDNGALFYYPGSHRLPKHQFPNSGLIYDGSDDRQVVDFEHHLERSAAEAGLERQVFEAKKGDVLFWHAALVHGGSPAAVPDQRRRSLVVHYSSKTAYPRDRRTPNVAPKVLARNGGELYLPTTPDRSLLGRVKGKLSSLLRG